MTGDITDEDLMLLYREGDGAARADQGMARKNRLLEVLGIEVAAAKDDEILEPAGDEDLAFVQETEIAGP